MNNVIRMQPTGSSPSSLSVDAEHPELAGPRAELCHWIARYATHDGVFATDIPGLHFARMSAPGGMNRAIHSPALCVIAQGSKHVILSDELYVYDALRYLVVSLDLPVCGQVVEATPEAPYLSFRLDFDSAEIAELMLQVGPVETGSQRSARGMFLGRTNGTMLDSVLRLIRLLASPEDIPVLAPLAKQEILYRTLKGEQGWRLGQIASSDSQAQRISRAIAWLKSHYAEPLRIEEVAREVHMSTSSLHHHFKAVTALSPLQYQKQLRLQEARRLLMNEAVDAATAGHRVGYESPSQFSREYSRLFGVPPARDQRRLRELRTA